MEGDPGYLDPEIMPVNRDASPDLWKDYFNVKPVPVESEKGSFIEDFSDALWKGISFPFKATGDAVGGAIDTVKSTVKNTWVYLVGGIALIGIIAIVLLGASSRFMSKIEGR